MQRLLQVLFPTLLVLALASPARANDCPGASAVTTGGSASLLFDAACDFGGPSCIGDAWFEWVPGGTANTVVDLNFQITATGNCNVNIYLLYSESFEAVASPCEWNAGSWSYTEYQRLYAVGLTAGVPYQFINRGLDATGYYFILIEKRSGVGSQVTLAPVQMGAARPVAANDNCANAISLGMGSGIDPNVITGPITAAWTYSAAVSTKDATKERLTAYCTTNPAGTFTEDHYSRKFLGQCFPTGRLGDYAQPPFGTQCVAALENTAFYTFSVPVSANNYYIHFGATGTCTQEPNNMAAMLFNNGFSCTNAQNNIALLMQCGSFTVTNTLPNASLTWGNLNLSAGNTYTIVVDGTRGSQCDAQVLITRGPANPILPVTLLSFDGEQQGNQTLLRWKTSSEELHDYFVVERSTDGEWFEPVGQIDGIGGVSQVAEYDFTDRHAPVGLSYYRLSMVDMNGGHSYSEVILLNRELSGVMVTGLVPNPATELTELHLSSPSPMHLRLELYDLRGQLRRVQEMQAGSGDLAIPLDLTSLPKGMYLLRASHSEGVYVEKLLVQ